MGCARPARTRRPRRVSRRDRRAALVRAPTHLARTDPVLLAADGLTPSKEDARTDQRERLGRRGGDSCLIEIIPLPSPLSTVWRYSGMLDERFSSPLDYVHARPGRRGWRTSSHASIDIGRHSSSSRFARRPWRHERRARRHRPQPRAVSPRSPFCGTAPRPRGIQRTYMNETAAPAGFQP